MPISEVLSVEQERKSLIMYTIALAFIYFVPAFSHLLRIPLYYAEPMRIMVILAIAHTNKRNAYMLALTLPLFSLVFSGHPTLYKSLLMSAELCVNVFLFYQISKKIENQFFSMFISILLSKALYYSLKFSLISFFIMKTDLISTPIFIQLLLSLVFSAYLFLVFYRKQYKGEVLVDPTKDESLY
jgi:hypothetical protein